MRIGFIGLGNVGSKRAGSLLRNGFDLTVRDLDDALVRSFVEQGAAGAASPKEMTQKVDLVITCLPSPAVCATVMESEDGVIMDHANSRPILSSVWRKHVTSGYPAKVSRLK